MSFDGEVFFESVRNKNKLLGEATENTLTKLGIQGATIAKRKATFENKKGYVTGQTKNSIQYSLANGKRGLMNDSGGKLADKKLEKPTKGNVYIGATTEHAVYLEFGTRKMHPQPFLRPALAEQAGKSATVIQKEMGDSIEEWKLWREKL